MLQFSYHHRYRLNKLKVKATKKMGEEKRRDFFLMAARSIQLQFSWEKILCRRSISNSKFPPTTLQCTHYMYEENKFF